MFRGIHTCRLTDREVTVVTAGMELSVECKELKKGSGKRPTCINRWLLVVPQRSVSNRVQLASLHCLVGILPPRENLLTVDKFQTPGVLYSGPAGL